MSIPRYTPVDESELDILRAELRSATELLERIIADRGLLADDSQGGARPASEAVALVYHPDAKARRTMVKAPPGSARRPPSARKRESSRKRASARCGGSRVQHAQRLPARAVRAGDVDEPDVPRDRGAAALLHLQASTTRRSITSTTSSARTAATFNFAKRTELADLRGRVALLTGGRVKIGYQAGLKLLRAGARLIVTTRFPRDSAARYAREPDFEEWSDRLEIFGLDLRHTPSVEAFCHELLATHDRLDFIINNACQTVRRPPAFYEHMMEGETAVAAHACPRPCAGCSARYEGLRGDAASRQHRRAGALPPRYAVDSNARDAWASCTRRRCRRWRCSPTRRRRRRHLFPRGPARPGSAAGRPARAQLVAPAARRSADRGAARGAARQRRRAVRPQRAPQAADAAHRPSATSTSSTSRRWRGSSTAYQKTTRHPHTNMAKAALNMMTRTSAADYFQRRHPHEQRGHRLGDRRGSGGDRGAQDGRAPLPSAARHRRWRGADRRSRSCPGSTRASTCGGSS